MNFTKLELLFVVLVTLHVLAATRGEQCGEVLKKPQTLIESGATFPRNRYLKKLKRARRGVQEWLAAAQENVDTIMKETGERGAGSSYPTCLYAASCTSVTRVAQFWQLPGEKCWNVEPLLWTECSTEYPKSLCNPTKDDSDVVPVGYSCRERYTNMNVWVYCRDKSGIQLRTIGVPTACIAVRNEC